MADVLHGNKDGEQLNARADKTQVYGLAGNDTLTSNGKSDVLLVGGSGDDSLIMIGGKATLSGGKGSDTFELNYSATNPISAVIEDLDPTSDKIIVNFDGKTAPNLSSVASGDDVVWTDGDGLFNLTLKSVRENDYFDGTIDDAAWEILKLTNDEREKHGLSPLTMADGLTAGAFIRAEEITELAETGALDNHTRPNGEEYYTVLDDKYHNYGENLDAGAQSPAEVMDDWIKSKEHRENILDNKSRKNFQKLGVGYKEDDSDPNDYRFYWVQMFADSLNNPETVRTAKLLTANIETATIQTKSITGTDGNDNLNNTIYGATIDAQGGADSITNTALTVSISGGKGNDTIDNQASFATVNGGAGDDSITLSKNAKDNLIVYSIGDGNDKISGFGATDTLKISGGEYTPETVNNDVVISVSKGSITLLNAAKLSKLNVEGRRSKLYIGTDDKDTISNNIEGATIRARGDNDSIENSGSKVEISGGSGKDTVKSEGDNVTIRSGDDNDKVKNSRGVKSKINLGADNDSIRNDNADSTINGGAGDDTIDNRARGQNVIIFGNAGDDSIKNVGDFVKINGGADADIIRNSGTNAIIDGGSNADTIDNLSGGKNSSITGGANDDEIKNAAENVTIAGDDGADTINNISKGKNSSINGGADNDSIKNAADFVTIAGGDGKDTIRNSGFAVIINGGLGDDSIKSSDANISITGGRGNDRISLASGAKNNVIQYKAGDGDDTITGLNADDTLIIGDGTSTYSTIRSGKDVIINVDTSSILLKGVANLNEVNISGVYEGDPTTDFNPIYNENSYSLVSGTNANDYIENSGLSVTINGGLGDDLISLTGDAQNNLIQYKEGDGNDVISGFNSTSTLNIVDGKYTRLTVENDIMVNVGMDLITLLDAASLSAINIAGAENVPSDADKLVILDKNANVHSNVVSDATIAALEGNDSINIIGSNVSVDGGADNDLIFSRSNSVTINGGKGDDSITLSQGARNNLIKYAAGDGNDLITGFNETSTLKISGGEYTSATVGNDVIVAVGEDSITLAGAATLSAVNINGTEFSNLYILTDGNDTYNSTVDGATILARGGDDSIKVSGIGNQVSGGTGDDTISLTSDSRDSQIRYAKGDGNDVITGFGLTDTLNIFGAEYSSAKSGDDVIITVDDSAISLLGAASLPSVNIVGKKSAASIISDNIITLTEGNDTYSNTDSGVTINALGGDDSIENSGASALISGGRGDDLISLTSDALDNVIVYNVGDGNDTIAGFNEETTSLSIVGGGYNSFSISGDNVVVNVGAGSITLLDAPRRISDIKITGTRSADNRKTIALSGNEYRNTDSDVIINATDDDSSIYNDSANVTINTGAGADSIENSRRAFSVNIESGAGNDYIRNNGSDVTIESGEGDDTIYSGDSLSGEGSEFSNSDSFVLKYTEGDGNDFIYGSNVTLSIAANNASVSSLTSGNNLVIAVGDDSITVANVENMRTFEVTVTANNRVILNDSNNTYSNTVDGATIKALGGADSISNSGANVTINAGADDDTISNSGENVLFQYALDDGNDVIEGFNSTSTLSISGNEYSSVISGDDMIINVGDGAITLSGAASLSTVNVDGTEASKLHILTEGNDTYSNAIAGATINALGGADSISNSGSNVTMNGGTGDDTISNSGANVLFQYALDDGNDVIEGFNSTSTLSISGEEYSSVMSGNDVIINVGDGAITLSGAASLSTVNIDGTEVSKLKILTEGNDTYSNTVDGATIRALGGADSISNSGANVTINGGTDDDLISNSGANVLFQYTAGEGNDVITGFNTTSTLSISGEEYSSTTSGDDVIINVGDNAITLNGAASLATVNIDGTEVSKLHVLTEGNDTYSNAIDNATILALGGADSIVNAGASVIIDASAGDDTIDNGGASVFFQYTLGDGNDLINGFRADSTLKIVDSNFTSVTSGDDIIFTVGNGAISLTGAASLDSINIEHIAPTIPAEALEHNGHYYHLFDENLTWEQAKTYCEARDGYLVTINDEAEQEHVQEMIKENGTKNSYWLGGLSSGGSWKWITDEIWEYTNWSDGKPDGDGNSLIMRSDSLGAWDNVNSDGNEENFGFICEWGDYTPSINPKIITLTEDADEYTNTVEGATVQALGGDDSIDNDIDGVTVELGAGNDLILNDSKATSIYGGAGNDAINTNGANVSISGGTGDDKITLSRNASNNFIAYNLGDGNDIIWGMNRTSSLKIFTEPGQEHLVTSYKRGGDVIYKFGDGSVTLKDARHKPLHIIIGESGSSGGGSGGNGGGTSGGSGGSGGGGGGGSTGGTSGGGNTSGASGGNSASGSSGNGGGTSGGNSGGTGGGSRSDINTISAATVEINEPEEAITQGVVIDKRGSKNVEVIHGMAGADTIYAGDSGGQLWGGADNASDVLYGGAGEDVFISGKNQGSDILRNVSPRDVVYLSDVNLSDIVGVKASVGSIALTFDTGNTLTIQSSELLSGEISLADDSSYRYNHMSGKWQN